MNERFYPNQGNVDSGNKLIFGLTIRNALESTNISVSGTAVALPASSLSKRLSVLIFNNSSDIVYVGASDVTTSNGYPIYPRGQLAISIDDGTIIYCVSAGTNSDIRVFEGG